MLGHLLKLLLWEQKGAAEIIFKKEIAGAADPKENGKRRKKNMPNYLPTLIMLRLEGILMKLLLPPQNKRKVN